MKVVRIVGLAAAMLALLNGHAALAGKARDYLNAPKDTWVTFYNAGYSTSVTPVEGGEDFGVPEYGTDVISQSVIVTRIMDFWGHTGGISVIAPYLDMSIDAGSYDSRQNGFGDLSFAWEVNLFGAPALSKEAFKTWTPETFASIHLVLTAPTGPYDSTDVLNTGSNRWIFTPTINYSYTPDQGSTWLEAYATAKLFTENHATKTTQDPLFLFETHASHDLTDRLWLSADAYYDVGGQSHVDGVSQEDAANTLRLGVGSGMRLRRGAQLMLNYDQVVARPPSEPDGKNVRLSLAQVW